MSQQWTNHCGHCSDGNDTNLNLRTGGENSEGGRTRKGSERQTKVSWTVWEEGREYAGVVKVVVRGS